MEVSYSPDEIVFQTDKVTDLLEGSILIKLLEVIDFADKTESPTTPGKIISVEGSCLPR